MTQEKLNMILVGAAATAINDYTTHQQLFNVAEEVKKVFFGLTNKEFAELKREYLNDHNHE